jgi:azurin
MTKKVANNAMAEGTHNNYVPSGKNVVAASPLAAPGETVEVTFKAPAPGAYQFISTFPDQGKLILIRVGRRSDDSLTTCG